MLTKLKFFKKTNISNKVSVGGPSADEQLLAMASGEYWIVLNTHLLQNCVKGSQLCDRVNAFKHALQTYGPVSQKLPDIRQGKGATKGVVFHGHVNDDNGNTYLLEWTIIDHEKRMMALVGFGSHENYVFRSAPLNQEERKKILTAPCNAKICEHAAKKVREAKEKVERVKVTYRNCK